MLIQLISNIFSGVISIFKVKSEQKVAEIKVTDDKVEQGTEQIKLQQTQAMITNNALLDHNTLAEWGMGFIWFSCGFAIFHDKVIAKLFADFGIHLSTMSDKDIWALIVTLVGNGTMHIAKNWNQG